MKTFEIEPEMEDLGIEQYRTNDSQFRLYFSDAQYVALPRRDFNTFLGKFDYDAYVSKLKPIVFIDLKDLQLYLKTKNIPGFGALRIHEVAEVVCDSLGNLTNIPDVLWNKHVDEIYAEVQGELGLDDDSDALGVAPFQDSTDSLFSIADVITRYMVQAGFPIVESESVYEAYRFERGLLVLRLRTWEEFVLAYQEE